MLFMLQVENGICITDHNIIFLREILRNPLIVKAPLLFSVKVFESQEIPNTLKVTSLCVV